MSKPVLWLFIAALDDPRVPAVVPTLAWLAEARGARLEQYLEAPRDGRLFARTGSTVLGGHHHQQFNYLHTVFDVRVILLGDTSLFRSSLSVCGGQVLAEAATVTALYQALDLPLTGDLLFLPEAVTPEQRPYLYQEIFFRRAIGMPESEAAGLHAARLDLPAGDDIAAFTTVLAERWQAQAQGVAFGDPAIILALLATLCRERRVAVFGPCRHIPPQQVVANAYAEEQSTAAAAAARLAVATGNRVLVGRQTGDGDLFAWSRAGVCIQIADPNRPAFPVVATVPHPWANRTRTVFASEPDDATLADWADAGKRLAALLVHSGEMAHNEGMLNLVELCGATGLKLGIGVHVARFETCPQLWELISVPRASGGALGLVEPVLHSGGMGVLTESGCPPEHLAAHCRKALARIAELCGDAWRPRGYLAFMDSDMATFTQSLPETYDALAGEGLAYTVSSCLPGRNRIIWQQAGHLVLNQSTRAICTGSPYVRVTTLEDLREQTPATSPGWWLGVIDAPVIAFNPYIWRHGSRFMSLVEWLTGQAVINVTPHVVARYARLLQQRGVLPACGYDCRGTL